MLGSYDTYTKYVKKKDDKELPKIMYHRAKLMMEHNKFDEAKPLLIEMITKFDDVKEAQLYAAWCSAMFVDLLTIRWIDKNNNPQQTIDTSNDLQEWATKLQGMKIWNHPENEAVREAVPTLLAGIGWKKGMAYRDAGKAYVEGTPGGDPQGFEKCATQFIDVFNNFEDHERAATLLWNAADCSDAAYQVGQAIQIRTALLDRFPNSEHAVDTLHFLAESYQAVAYYDDSAKRYEQFAEEHAKDDRAVRRAAERLPVPARARTGGQGQGEPRQVREPLQEEGHLQGGQDLLVAARPARLRRLQARPRRGVPQDLRDQGRHRSCGRGRGRDRAERLAQVL